MIVREECVEARNSPIIVAEENGRRMVFKNPGRKSVSTISVDRCVFKGNSTHKRCDYLVEIGEPMESAHYIELKGTKIAHGIEQLSASLGYFVARHEGVSRTCVLIASTVPSLKAGTQMAKDKFFRDNKVKLEIRRSEYTIDV